FLFAALSLVTYAQTTDPDGKGHRKIEAGGESDEVEHAEPRRGPLPWGQGMKLQALDLPSDTISFHIGSPLFLQLDFSGPAGCEPGNGRPFYFEASGAQLGW